MYDANQTLCSHTIRQSISALHMDLEKMWTSPRQKRKPTNLEKVIDNNGGSYKTSGYESVFFHMYTNVQFSPAKAERRNFAVGLSVDAPPGPARDPSSKKRAEYWEHSQRLKNGSLVVLVLVSSNSSQIYLGTITSMGTDIAESAKALTDRIQLHVSFFDAEIELAALRQDKFAAGKSKFGLLIDNNIMFESIRPFLETL